MRLLALVAAGLLIGPLLAAPVPKGLKKAGSPLDGIWEVVDCSFDDKPQRATPVQFWEIEDGWAEVSCRGVCFSRVQLNRPDGADANAVNYHEHALGVGRMLIKTPTFAGVFEREGDTLRFCFSTDSEQPNDFTPGDRRMVYLLKRVKEEKKDK